MTALRPALLMYLSLPPLLWAGNAVVGRLMVGQVSPLTLNALRWLLAALFLLPLGWRALRPVSRIRQRWVYLALISLFSVGLFNALQYLALVTSTPMNVTLMNSSLSVWMLLIGAVFYGEHPSRRQWLGAGMGSLGVLWVISRGSWEVLMKVHLVPGDLFTLVAILGWAAYSWMLARPPAHMRGAQRPDWDWAGFLLIQVLFGLVPSVGLGLAEQAFTATPPLPWSWTLVGVLLYISLGASVVAYRCWGLGVAQGGPALAALFNNLTPLFAALLSVLFLGELPQVYHLVAFGLIAGGIGVSLGRRAPG